MPGPIPATLNPIPTTAAWDASKFTVSYIGSANTPGIDAATGRQIAHILYSSFGDLTGDGWPEIVISGWSYRSGFGSTPGTPPNVPITMISTSAAGATQISAASLLGVAASQGTALIRIADFNGDGKNDLFIAGHNESPFTPVPSTLFSWTASGFSNRTTSFLTTSHEGYNGDFNGDGIMDVVASAYHSSGPMPEIWTTGNSYGTTWFQTNSERAVLILNLGDGQGGFQSFPIAFDRPNADLTRSDAYTFANWTGGSASAFADFDNDGRSEIVVVDLKTRANYTNAESYLISNIQFESNSAFGTLTSLPRPYFDRNSTYSGATSAFEPDKSHALQVLIFDYNNDGLVDVLINSLLWNPGNSDGGQDYSVTQVLRNDGGLRFTDVTDSVFFNAYLGKQDPGHDSILIDVNGDGFLDLVSTSEPDYVNGQVRPNSQSNEVFINTGDGKFVSVMWSQFDGLTATANSLLLGQGVSRGSFQGTGHTFFPYVRPDGALSFVTFENVQRGDGTVDQHFFNVTPNQAFSTGPGGTNPASMGAAGFNEAYYLSTYASVASAVQSGQFASGLAHYLAVGRELGLNGFAKNAQVLGTAASDVISLREGNEKAFGLGGDDIVQGGFGNDYLDGGAGFDIADYATASVGVSVNLGLTGAQSTVGAGTDTLVSIEGIRGSAFADVLTGNQTANLLSGIGGNDTVFGGDGADTVTATSGQTYLRGEAGEDSLSGGSGFDDMHGNMGNDTLRGNDGEDWVVGGKDNDLLFGDAAWDIVYGNMGNDTVDGGAGNDWVRGGQGDDTVMGGAGDDWIWGDKGNDTISGGAGADIFHSLAGAAIDRITDFSYSQGDRLVLDGGPSRTIAQVGSDVVVDMGNGDHVILVGVSLSSLGSDWIS